MLGEENSLGQDAEDDGKKDLKFELAVLNAALKDLNKNWDFTVLINPLLADQGPAIAVVPKLKKQIDRMAKLGDEILQKKQAHVQGRLPDAPGGRLLHREERTQQAEFQHTESTDQGRPPAAPAQTVGGSMHPKLGPKLPKSPRPAHCSV